MIRPTARSLLRPLSLATLVLLVLLQSLFSGGISARPSIGIPAAVTEAYERAEKEIFHLEQTSFQTKTKQGDWLVFFGATWCGHCQRLTPIWLELQKKVGTELKDNNFNIAKVECTLNPELCESLEGFPTIYHYTNGVRASTEVMDRNLDDLFKFVKEHVRDHTGKSIADSGPAAVDSASKPLAKLSPMDELLAYAEQEVHPGANVNPDGLVVHLTRDTFKSMFHAPWCGHCKTLSPIWDQLAEELKGRVNIGKVNCDTEKGDVAFFFVYDAAVTDHVPFRVFQSVAKTVKPFAKLYVSPELRSYKMLHLKNNGPTLIAIRDAGLDNSVYTGGFTSDSASRTALRDWIMKERFPLVTKLEASTQTDIMEGNRLIALAIIDPNLPSGQSSLAHFRNSAKFWKKEAPAADVDRVKFAWIDAVQYQAYIFSVYSVKPMDLPVFVVANPATEEYFDQFANGDKYDSFAKVVVHASIKEVLSGNGKAKTNQSFISRTTKWITKQVMGTLMFVVNNILVSVLLFGGIVMAATYYALNMKNRYQSVPSNAKAE
ncbi:hypothetical protein BSLG_008960 [Batrachochytrium salamandrivorans]|nr:hypothetical protein BSLG_008960 [Batrachochytrium salamandrivorans]